MVVFRFDLWFSMHYMAYKCCLFFQFIFGHVSSEPMNSVGRGKQKKRRAFGVIGIVYLGDVRLELVLDLNYELIYNIWFMIIPMHV